MYLEPFRSFHSIFFSYYHVYQVRFDLLRTTHYYLNEQPKGMCEAYVSTHGRCICQLVASLDSQQCPLRLSLCC
jgi:hypothetical protein